MMTSTSPDAITPASKRVFHSFILSAFCLLWALLLLKRRLLR
jgi:hypothetical protein